MKSHLALRFKIILFLLIGGTAVYLAFAFGLIPDFGRKTEISFSNNDDAFYIAVAGPMSGKKKKAGDEMVRGVRFCLEQVNKDGGINGKPVKAVLFDEQGDPLIAHKRALEIAEHPNIIMVLGHSNSNTSMKGGEVYREAGIPAITASATAGEVTKGNDWYFRTIFDNRFQGAFLANYVKKILKTDTVSIIYGHDVYGASLSQSFYDTFKALEGKIKYRQSFDRNAPNADEIIDRIISDLKNQVGDDGMIFLATFADAAAKLTVSIRRKGLNMPIIGGDDLGDNTFAMRFNEYPEEHADPGYFSDGIYAVTPSMSDVASEKIRQFRNMYAVKYDEEPGWVAISYYEAAFVAVQAIKMANVQGRQKFIIQARRKVRDVLAESTIGNISFDKHGDVGKAPVIGHFQNQNFISALTQLQSVPTFNIVANTEKADRIISVDNKPMSKTNVVYTGINIRAITDLDMKNLLYTMDFSLWFRFQGTFNPADIEFLNAVEPIQLQKPSYQKVSEQFTYRLYNIKAQFHADFLSTRPAFRQHILGLSFRHKNLNRNQLIYVIDMLGMGLTSELSLHEELQQKQILKPVYGWTINRSWLFPDIVKEPTLGKPRYLNLSKRKADYSRFNFGIGIKKDTFSFRRLLPGKIAVIMLIVSVLILISLSLSGKRHNLPSSFKFLWFLQVILTFFVLLSGEVLILDWLRGLTSAYYQERILIMFDIFWWVVPAVLIIRTIERFVWIPVEALSNRTVPNIVRRMVALIILFLAFAGIVAFVFDRKLTGLLATSGMVAMIVGLAAQMNISNLISGIVLNIERPFRIDDWIKIGENTGKIIDMTWRTTRLRTIHDNVISIPNCTVSDSLIENYQYPDNTYWEGFTVNIDPIHRPDQVKKLLRDAVLSVKYRLEPWVVFRGVNEWAANYWVYYSGDDYTKRSRYRGEVWDKVWAHLDRAGIKFAIKDRAKHRFRQEDIKKEEPLAIIEKIDTLQPFSAKAKSALAQRMQRHNIPSDGIVMRQGDSGDSLFIIAEGVIGVWVQIENKPDSYKEVEIARLMIGDIIGESKTATVKAITDSVLYEITKADIAPFIKDQSKITEQLIEILKKRTIETDIAEDFVFYEKDGKKALSKQFLNNIQGAFRLKR
ncbi:ABC transporter substrate-binding protein [Desulfococcaceae bacterium HSG9]|nr:ABC transporter substrate-binding protein [Desulfococcaceae bacterium HSG9]